MTASARLLACLLALLCGGGCVASGPAPRSPALRHAVADLHGLAVHYDDVGSGDRALVFLHGWASDSRVWAGQVPALADLGRLLVIDLPGHGRSDQPQSDCTMALFADAVEAVLDDAGVSRCVLVAHSNGAPVALAFARTRPGRTRGLITIEGALRLMIEDAATRERVVGQFKGEGAQERAVGMLEASLGAGRDPAELADLLAMVRAVPRHVMESSLDAAWDPAAWSTARLDTPVLALMAESPYWSAEYEQGLRTFIPELDFQRLQGVSHFVQLDRPGEVNRRIATWVRRRNLLD